MLDLLKDTGVGALILPAADGYGAVIERARRQGLTVCDPEHPPAGVAIVKGEWPGIRMTPGQGDASAGPTGALWIDSNGWLVRLTRVQKPGATVWVIADPPKTSEIIPLSRHLVAVADGAAHGGCWAIAPDRELAANRDGWRKLMAAVAFFQAHAEWGIWPADGVLAVVSSFAGDNEFFSHELLNLLARTNVTYDIVEKSHAVPESWRGLRAVLYTDTDAPASNLRQGLLEFVERGGLLIAVPAFGKLPGAVSPVQSHPRYEIRRLGKGTIAVAREAPSDPYEVAQDAQILLSHRYDRVRFFNGFLLAGYCTKAPDGKHRLAHVINYGGGAGDDPPSARLAGEFRSARLWSFEHGGPQPLRMAAQRGGVEVHLPPLDVYGGIELEVLEHA